MNEPYEVIPEGEKHAKADWITKVIAAVLVALIILLAASCPAKAEEKSWCALWSDGYEYSYYLKCHSCQDIPPGICPDTEYPGQDGMLKGIKDGAADGKAKQKEMQQ